MFGGGDAGVVGAREFVKVVDKKVAHGQGAADNKLGDLKGGEGLLEPEGESYFEAGEGEVCVHEGMDERVEHHKDPDWGRHVSNAGPHAEDGTRVVIALKEGGRTALEKDDDGVENFIVFGEVKEITPEGETFERGSRLVGPEGKLAVIADGLPEQLRKRMLGIEDGGHGGEGKMCDGGGHAHKSPDRVNTQCNVVENDKHPE